jgi:hypothetical protein
MSAGDLVLLYEVIVHHLFSDAGLNPDEVLKSSVSSEEKYTTRFVLSNTADLEILKTIVVNVVKYDSELLFKGTDFFFSCIRDEISMISGAPPFVPLLFKVPPDSPFYKLYDDIDMDEETFVLTSYYPFLTSACVSPQFFDRCLDFFVECLKRLNLPFISQMQFTCLDSIYRHHSVCQFLTILEKTFIMKESARPGLTRSPSSSCGEEAQKDEGMKKERRWAPIFERALRPNVIVLSDRFDLHNVLIKDMGLYHSVVTRLHHLPNREFNDQSFVFRIQHGKHVEIRLKIIQRLLVYGCYPLSYDVLANFWKEVGVNSLTPSEKNGASKMLTTVVKKGKEVNEKIEYKIIYKHKI